ncbi:hypothetical protein [Rothia halotolerans]|uniref:hypothetical protein n=1 Tax=Rothia halotolerans TaxID=405770 RepID=UPI00101D875A|nr:hypothetical protein [Rothia halotolerans]
MSLIELLVDMKVAWKTRGVRLRGWWRWVIALAPFGPCLAFVGRGVETWADFSLILLSIAAAAILCWPMVFATHSVGVGGKFVRLIYWPLYCKTISYEEIDSVKFCEVFSWRDAAGLGLRYSRGYGLMFINRNGPGISIQTRTGKIYSIVIPDSCDRMRLMESIDSKGSIDFSADFDPDP